MDHRPFKQLDRDSGRRPEGKPDSADDQSFFLNPADDIDPATRDRDERPRIQLVGCGVTALIPAAIAAGAVLRAQTKPPSLWSFVGLFLLFIAIVTYLIYWVGVVHPDQINEKLRAERAARGLKRRRQRRIVFSGEGALLLHSQRTGIQFPYGQAVKRFL
jgi:hypothetical protein